MGRDVMLITFTRILAVLMMLATSVCISRTLGPEGQGVYFLGMMFCATQVQLANLGLHNSHTYLLAGNRVTLPALLGNTVLASTIIASLFAVLGLGSWWLLGWADATNILPLALGAAIVPSRLFFTLGTSLLVALNKIRAFNKYMLIGNATVLFAVFLVSLGGPHVVSYLLATALGAIITAVMLYRRLALEAGSELKLEWPTLRSAAQIGQTTYVVCLLTFLVTRLNVFILEHLCGSQAVGQYSVVAQMMDVLMLIPSSWATILFPKLVQDPAQRSELTWRSLGTITLLMTACIGTVWLFAAPAIRLVYGEAYIDAVSVVLPISPAILCCSLVNVIQPYFNANKFPCFTMIYWFFGVVVLIATSLIFIPKYQERGAAWALSAAYAFVFSAFAIRFLVSEIRFKKTSTRDQSPESITLATATNSRAA